MSETTRCLACGVELSQDANPQGLCAACLLRLGLSSTNIPAPELPQPAKEESSAKHARHRWRRFVYVLVAAAATLTIAAAVLRFFPRRAPPSQVIRFSLSLPNAEGFAISPDGRLIAFAATNEDGKTALWIHSMDSFKDTPLAGTEGAVAPFWSPDSRFIGFFARGKLKKIDINGAAETLCDAPKGKSGAWGIEGVIVFERDGSGVLYKVSNHGGTPAAVTRIEPAHKETAHRWPHFLPDGRHFIYTSSTINGEDDAVFIGSLDTGEALQIMNGRTAAVYANGSLLFVRTGILLFQPFDPIRLRLSGDARAVRFTENVGRFSASANGLLAYRQEVQVRTSPLIWMDREGRRMEIIEGLTGADQFSISPDGRTVAASRSGDIWLADLNRGVVSRFTFDPAKDAFPVWSPDGSRIVFVSSRGGRRGLYQKALNASTNEELLFADPQMISVESWSPDGKFIAYTSQDDKGKSAISLLPLNGDRKPSMIQSVFNLRDPHFSPDGRWLAYVSDESGEDQIYIQSFPLGGSKWQVSLDGGTRPAWRRDGRELFYVSKKMLMSISIPAAGASLSLTTPRPVFHMQQQGFYDASGERFLMPLPTEDRTSVPIDIVVNWASEKD